MGLAQRDAGLLTMWAAPEEINRGQGTPIVPGLRKDWATTRTIPPTLPRSPCQPLDME